MQSVTVGGCPTGTVCLARFTASHAGRPKAQAAHSTQPSLQRQASRAQKLLQLLARFYSRKFLSRTPQIFPHICKVRYETGSRSLHGSSGPFCVAHTGLLTRLLPHPRGTATGSCVGPCLSPDTLSVSSFHKARLEALKDAGRRLVQGTLYPTLCSAAIAGRCSAGIRITAAR